MAATKPPAGLHFLIATGVEKPDPKLRKFIRSHVMLGKNRGKTRSMGKKGQKTKKGVPSSNSNTSLMNVLDAAEALARPSATATRVFTTTSQSVLPLTIPRKFGGDMAAMRFPDTATHSLSPVSFIAKKILFPLEPCVFFERKAETWIAPLTFDPAFLHTMLFTSQYYFDAIAAGKTSALTKVTLHHFLKALKLLRERMSRDDDQAALSDTTAAAIMALSGHALMTGDFDSAMNHIEGLHKIVGLRGGVATFRSNAKLLIEILRCDIGMVLHRGSRPVFFNHLTPHETFLPYPDLTELLNLRGSATMASQYSTIAFLDDVDGELSNAWNALSAFCSVINFAVDSGQYISLDTYLDTMASVMYRLLSMRFGSRSSGEAVRLGLLVFSSSVLLQWRLLGLSYVHLTSEFRGCLVRLASTRTSSQLLLWLLMVGAVSPLLIANMGCCDIYSWDKMQDLLNSFMWIGLVHDKAARTVFNSTIAYVETGEAS
ncbi:hypothetical protein NA57DRAFT_67545 [Rhizodiscina lignyota]|uniref:Tachykinin family protein n=1 Tax=Rhizodiscina lignyota TaxID=1504668 RepID=A0A9P4ICR3_9PEZI|nr:hypothetical protein NA57DRAFT_67545 [Rhizodiscina lignyota]